MPAVQRSEFFLALNQVATERGVDVNVIIDAVKNAILAAYRKDHPEIVVEEYDVTLNPNSGEARVMHQSEDVTPPGFGRIAAQTAKQVILQKVREEEKQAILADYKLRIGTVMNGMVLRFAGPNVIIDLGKAEALMPVSEQIPSEQYRINQRLAVYLVEIRDGVRGQELIVSRSHQGLLEGLFTREVPEIAQRSVVIEKIAREPGIRSKIAVAATQPGIDPVGSCVGQRGVRVQAVIQEVGNEKIDVIPFEKDVETFIRLSLAPAKEMKVTVDEANKTAEVAVAKEELSSAIGKDGQNVRLASELTGYKINITEGASSQPAENTTEKKEVPADDAQAATTNQPAPTQSEPAEEATTTPQLEADQPVAEAAPATEETQQPSEEKAA